jgi:O-antigen/teichoic acid export membrane protein
LPTLTKHTEQKAEPNNLVVQASQGIKAVVTRQIVTKLMGLGSTLVLARLLSPADFGIYAIVCFAVTMFGLMADAGLAVALLRQPTEPTIREESSIFWCQLILALTHCILVQTFAEPVGKLYHLSPGSILLIRTLSVSSVLAIFITLPMIKLERRLDFNAQAKIEMMQSFTYNLSAILMAFLHLGAWTFAMASIASQLVAILMLRFISPFTPKICIDIAVCKEKLGFGLKFQGTNILGFLKETINPLFVGLVSGTTAVGLVNFATTTAGYSLMVTHPFARLYFPVFCRAQQEPEVIVKVAEASVRWNFLIVAGFTAVALPVTDMIIEHAFGEKWLPCVVVINCLLVANVIAGLAYPLTQLSNAMNRADLPLKLSLATSALSWIALPIILPHVGLAGFGALQIVNQLLTLIFVYTLQKLVPLKLWDHCVKPSLYSALLTLALVELFRMAFPLVLTYYAGLLTVGIVAICFYFVCNNFFWKGLLLIEAKSFVATLRSRM